MNDFDYSSTGFAMTRSFEGVRLEAYQDPVGIWTIGYGHTGPDVHEGLQITEAEAEQLLRSDLASSIKCVQKGAHVQLAQCQFDALVDFCFNAGPGNLLGSTLLRCVNSGDFGGATAQFGLWVHAGGRVLPGLVRRRAAEAALFSGQVKLTPSTEVGVAEPGSALAPNGNGI